MTDLSRREGQARAHDHNGQRKCDGRGSKPSGGKESVTVAEPGGLIAMTDVNRLMTDEQHPPIIDGSGTKDWQSREKCAAFGRQQNGQQESSKKRAGGYRFVLYDAGELGGGGVEAGSERDARDKAVDMVGRRGGALWGNGITVYASGQREYFSVQGQCAVCSGELVWTAGNRVG